MWWVKQTTVSGSPCAEPAHAATPVAPSSCCTTWNSSSAQIRRKRGSKEWRVSLPENMDLKPFGEIILVANDYFGLLWPVHSVMEGSLRVHFCQTREDPLLTSVHHLHIRTRDHGRSPRHATVVSPGCLLSLRWSSQGNAHLQRQADQGVGQTLRCMLAFCEPGSRHGCVVFKDTTFLAVRETKRKGRHIWGSLKKKHTHTSVRGLHWCNQPLGFYRCM